MEVSTYISIAGVVISIITALLSYIKWRKYDKKMTLMDRQIKAYQLQNIQDEKEAQKHAIIRAVFVDNNKCVTTISIVNKGKSSAKNITLDSTDGSKLSIKHLDQTLPYPQLNTGEDFTLQIRTFDIPAVVTIKLQWEDESGKQEYEQALKLY